MGWITAAIAIVGMIGGGIAAGASTYSQQEELQKKKEREERIKNEVLSEMDLNFNTAKKEAIKNADKADKQSDFNERAVSENTNNQIEQIQANQEKETAQFNLMSVQAGQNEGQALSNVSQSGTRAGGSMSQAIDLQKAMSMDQIQREEDAARANDKIGLANVLQNLANNVNGIQNDRTGAYDLRHSYDVGGDNYNIYKAKRDRTENAYNDQIEDFQDAYDDIEKNRGWKILGGMFGGGAQGLQVGQSLGRLSTDLGLDTKFKSATGGNTNTNMQLNANNMYWANKQNALKNDLFKSNKVSTFNYLG